MSLADLRRHRLQRQEERRRRRRDAREQAKNRPPSPTEIPFPSGPDGELRFLNEFCWWPHEKGGRPIRGTYTQADLDSEAAFHLDENGDRIGGSDCERKPRKFKRTSRILGRIFYHLIRAWLVKREAWNATSAFEVAKPEKLRPILRRVQFMLRHLPQEWVRGYATTGNMIGLKQGDNWVGWSWNLVSAGAGLAAADKVGRSDTTHIVHMSESRAWAYPEESMSSLVDSMPSDFSGWLVDETTFPADRDAWAAAEYFRTKAGTGSFTKAHFWRWFDDPSKRVPRGSPDYERVMGPAFVLSEVDREAEQRLQLDDEQCAFRRLKRCSGSKAKRRLARAEFPESEDDAFSFDGDTWLDADALEVVRATAEASTPSARAKFGPMQALVWRPEQASQHVVVGLDTYEFGRDQQAAVFLDRETGDQLGQVHGQGLYEHFALGVAWVLLQLDCGLLLDPDCFDPAGRYRWRANYTLAVEVNRGLGFGPELQKLGLELWCQPTPPGYKAKPGEKPRRRWGVSTQAGNRWQYFNRIAAALEGAAMDEGGESLPPSPLCKVRSTILAHQLGNLVQVGDRVQPHSGHDDLVMAYGIALWVRPQVKPQFSLAERFRALASPVDEAPRFRGLGPPV